jgi:hypothetical protein
MLWAVEGRGRARWMWGLWMGVRVAIWEMW